MGADDDVNGRGPSRHRVAGIMVAAHLASPGSAGLFHREVMQSAFAVMGSTPAHAFIPAVPELPEGWISEKELDELGAATAIEHGWVKSGNDTDSALDRLRRVPVADLLTASGTFIRPDFGGGHVQSLSPRAIGCVDYAADHQLDFWADVG